MGELIAFLRREDLGGRYWRANELWITDRKGERARKYHTGQFYNPHVSWSLDSRLVTFEVDENGERYIYTVDWKFGQTKQLVRGDGLLSHLHPIVWYSEGAKRVWMSSIASIVTVAV